VRDGRIGGRRVRTRGEYRLGFEFVRVGERKTMGEYRLMKLTKLKKKRKNYPVFYFAEERMFFLIFMT
jgi:hypothetical protein